MILCIRVGDKMNQDEETSMKMSGAKEFQFSKETLFRISLQAVVYCGAWLVMYFAVREFFANSPARNVYAIISSWWLHYMFRVC